MKRTLLNQLIQHLPKAKISFAMLMFTFTMLQLNAQVDCNSIMACNDNLQVSLDDNCEALILPNNILEAQEYPNNYYTVVLTDQNGDLIPNATVTDEHIGQTISTTILLNGCSNSCWGSFIVEDKLPPVITCTEVFLECSVDPNADPVYPIAHDACSSVVYGYSDVAADLGCNTAYSKVITRSWIVADASGNTATCDQHIYIKQGKLDDITWPRNRDDIDLPVYECDDNISLLDNGAPDPIYSGFPNNVDCGNIQFYYEDLIFEICGSSTKTVRQWTVINWCTGEDTTHNQVIKIMDKKVPVCIAPVDVYSGQGTDEGVCTGTWVVGKPNVIDCSDWDYIVEYKLRDENGDPYEFPISDNVVKHENLDGTYYYTITELPQDTTWIVYTITDVCGNETQCFTEVVIEDLEKPTAICEGYTVVSLDDIGWADVFAESIDDHSWDNCGIDSFAVKRLSTSCTDMSEDLVFGDRVNFCCEDVGAGYIRVVMRVYDLSGNYNDCIVNVTVQDKFKPSITCPANKHIACTQDYNDLLLTGIATAKDNCSISTISHTDVTNLNDCGVGTISRTWTVTDPQGVSVSCIQFIYVDNMDPIIGSDIVFPGEIEIVGCTSGSGLHPDSLNSKPIINNTSCNNLAIGYNDQFFYNVPGFCVKIIRKWSIMDWCSTNSNGQGSIIATKDQIIKIINTEAPVFTDCNDVYVDAEEGTCSKELSVASTATDDCTATVDLYYSWAIDYNNNGTIDNTGVGNTTTKEYEVGRHRVIFTARDECGNEGECTIYVNIGDNKAPTPYCIEEVVWALDENGEAIVWASDFNLKSEDTCPAGGTLSFSFTPPNEGLSTSKTFTCDDLENGIAQLIPLSMYVIDASGNFSYCNVHLNLQDNQNACTDLESAMASISGKVMFTNNEGITDLDVRLTNVTESEDADDRTQTDGSYSFEEVNYYNNYKVSANSEKPLLEGVSTLDLLLIQRHILKLKSFDDPFKVISADIDNSGSITAADLIALRKALLGKTTEFPNNNSWKYINAATSYDEVNKPWDYEESFNIHELYLSESNADLYALKVGDVDQTIMENYTNGGSTDRSNGTIGLNMTNQALVSGQDVIVNISLSELIDLRGMQFTVDFDAEALSYVDMNSDRLSLGQNNISLNLVERGKITLSWNNSSAVKLIAGDNLLTIRFKAKAKGQLSEMLSINSNLLSAEIYNSDFETLNIEWNVNDASIVSASEQILLQNSPNPFKSYTNIIFDLPEAQQAKLTIRNLSGRLVKTITTQGQKGRNNIYIEYKDLAIEGVYYYTLESKDIIVTKRMIMLK